MLKVSIHCLGKYRISKFPPSEGPNRVKRSKIRQHHSNAPKNIKLWHEKEPLNSSEGQSDCAPYLTTHHHAVSPLPLEY